MFPYCCFLEKFFEGYFDRIGECAEPSRIWPTTVCALFIFEWKSHYFIVWQLIKANVIVDLGRQLANVYAFVFEQFHEIFNFREIKNCRVKDIWSLYSL